MNESHTHSITVITLTIASISCEEVVGALAVLTQAIRCCSVDDDITGPTSAVSNPALWPSTSAHTVLITSLTVARLVRVCRLWTLVYTERAVLEVTTRVTVVCPLHTVKQTDDIKQVTRTSSFFNNKLIRAPSLSFSDSH